jgi:hypothetical protein
MLMKMSLIKIKLMRMMIQCNIKLKNLTQEFTKACNMIIQWITSLGAFKKRGNNTF